MITSEIHSLAENEVSEARKGETKEENEVYELRRAEGKETKWKEGARSV